MGIGLCAFISGPYDRVIGARSLKYAPTAYSAQSELKNVHRDLTGTVLREALLSPAALV